MFLKDAMKAKMPVIVITTMTPIFAQKEILDVYLLCKMKKSDGKMKLKGTKPIEPTIPITSAADICVRNALTVCIITTTELLQFDLHGIIDVDLQ